MSTNNRLVFGVGVNDLGETKDLKAYNAWCGMLRRSYSIELHNKYPSYLECVVCEEWKYFSNFKKWYDENYREWMHLDKDILVEGNKIYSPETCRFVPQSINSVLTDCSRSRRNLPIGIRIQKTKQPTYQAMCGNGHGERISKTFKTLEEASAWYSATKTRVVREVSQKALDAGEIQQDIFDALVSRKFNAKI